MAINFPSNPTNGQTITVGSSTWVWSGVSWNIQPPGSNLDDLSDVDVAGATNGQVLSYNASSGNWQSITLTSTFNGGTILNPLSIQNNTASPNTLTGALVVQGGVGIGGALNVGGTGSFGDAVSTTGLTVTTNGASITGNSSVTGTFLVSSTTSLGGTVTVRSGNEIRLNDTDNTNYIGFRSPANLTQNTTYQLPAVDGSAGFVLSTNGLGALSWVAQTGGGGGGGGSTNPPGGVSGSVQFNNNNLFGGTTTFTYDQLTDKLVVFNIEFSGTLDATNNGTITNLSSIDFFGSTPVITGITDDTALSGNSNATLPTEAAVKTYVDDGLNEKAPINNPAFTGTVTGISKSMVGLGNVENTALSTWPGSSNITNIGTLPNLTVTGNITSNPLPTTPNHVTNKKYVDARAIAMGIAMS